MPLWAVTLLHYWLVVDERRPRYGLALALDVALILLTTYAGAVLVGLLVLFTALNARTRAAAAHLRSLACRRRRRPVADPATSTGW